MDYAPLLNFEDLESVFKTERGSTYAQHSDSTTTRNRSGANHKDTSEGIQPRSRKTVFMDPVAATNVAGVFQNPEMSTRMVPVLDADGKPTGRLALDLMDDYGPKKAGERLGTAPYDTRPSVGKVPVEIMNHESPLGSTGKGVHFGNKITEVHHKPQASGGGGGGGMNLGGAGGISAGKDALKEGLNPFAINRLYATGGQIDKPLEGNWKYI